MRKLLYQWAKVNRIIFVNAGSLVGTTAVTSALGFIYWWLAARQFAPEAVGIASATISVMKLVGNLCILGLGTLLIGELPRQPGKEASLISAALILVGAVGGCVGIVFAFAAPLLSPDFQVLKASIQDIATFAIGVSLTSITLVLDQALIGLLRGEIQLWRNALFAIIKLAALFLAGLWLSRTTGMTIYGTWALGNALSVLALAAFALKKGGWQIRTYLPEWSLLRKLGPAAIKHHILNLTLQIPSMVLPVLVTVMLSATTNAWFYISWNIASLTTIVTVALTIALYAEGAAQPGVLAHKTRVTLSLAFAASVLANAVLLFGTKQVLSVFGQSYVEQAASSLRILGLGAFPVIIRNHYLVLCRIQGRVVRATLLMMIGGLLELGLAALGAGLDGLLGLSLGWLAAVCIEAIYMSGTVYKVVRSIEPSIHAA
ncbi:MAG: hypothetical protein NVSMB49_08160 [Ktedonobacteraceae bacterium]